MPSRADMKTFGQQCRDLRKRGHTLSEIVQLTGRPKTSVYFHIKDLALDPRRLLEAKKKAGERIRVYAVERKGKSVRSFRNIHEWTPETVLLMGHLLFDGEISRAKCAYNNRNRALLARVESLMGTLYDFEPSRYKNIKTGVARITYHNVALGAHLQEKSKELLEVIHQLPLSHKREFLRAFFDDEGCIDFRMATRKKRVRGYQKNVTILRTIQLLLRDFSISSRIVLPNEVTISGKDNLQKFEKEINFSPGVFINGARSNSIWKEDLEKRDILARAIASYVS